VKDIKAIVFDLGNTLISEGFSLTGTIRPISGVLETLAALDGKAILCVASNSAYPLEHTARLLEQAEIRGYFQHLFSSASLGVAKPNPHFFHQILTTINVQPAQCIMIGDSYTNDIVGAKAVGLWTIWLTKYTNDDAAYADVVINTMHETLNAIQRLGDSLSSV
jgi:putative hydrolase of the HAD superfamily